jgi:hypothetical protein
MNNLRHVWWGGWEGRPNWRQARSNAVRQLLTWKILSVRPGGWGNAARMSSNSRRSG